MTRAQAQQRPTDYAALSVAEVGRGLEAVAVEARATFGGLDARQLNWQPAEGRWSVGQCLAHLRSSNRQMIQAIEAALEARAPRTVWQRLPILPGFFGRMLIRSQSPRTTRRFTAPRQARPPASDVEADIVQQLVDQHRDAVVRLQTLDDGRAAAAIMTSPFINFVAYSVLDGWRLILAHDLRHLEQARAVTRSPGFPGS